MSDRGLRQDILAANENKLKMFDRKRVAKQYIRLLEGDKKAGLFGIQKGKLDEKTIARIEKLGILKRFPR